MLLVATNGAAWLPDVVSSLRRQTYRPFEVVAVDNASEDSSGALLEEAFGAKRVVTLERRAGYGRALSAGLRVVADRRMIVDHFLLLHDDCALDPGALEALVAEISQPGVGIVGAKLVEWESPDVLQDVGGTTDRYGRIFPLVERGELDHGQYDQAHEVLYANSAALLVSREVVERVGLFDPRYVALRDDYDLCWRARIAGFRVRVTGATRARHALAGFRQVRSAPTLGRIRYFGDRNMIATLLKNYRLPGLLLVLPVTLVLSILGAVVFALTGRQRAARQILEALQWNVAHLPSTLRWRRRVQRARRQGDRAITELMVHGAPRLRGYLERGLEAVFGSTVDVVEDDEALDAPPPRVIDRLRAHPMFFGVTIFGLLYVIGARSLLGPEQLAGTDFPRYPGATQELFAEYLSGWRSGQGGGAGPASPALLLLGFLRVLCFGSAWLAQRVLLIGLPLLAGMAAWRLAGALGLRRGARRVAALTYAMSPLALGALGEGRLADMVLVAAAPALLTPLLRAAGLAPAVGWRSVAAGAAGLAATAAIAPWALPFIVGAAVVVSIAGALSGRGTPHAQILRCAVLMLGGAALLLFPWTFELVRESSPVGWGGPGGLLPMSDLLGLGASGVRVVPPALSYALPVAAVFGLAFTVAARRPAARVLAVSAVASVLVAWAVARGVPWIAPRAAQPLVLAAIAAAVLAGFGWEGLGRRLAAREFGVLHIGSALVVGFLAAQLAMTTGWIAGGNRPGIVEASSLLPAFLEEEERTEGAFRILWVSGSAARVHVSLSPAGGETLRSYGTRFAGADVDAVRRAVATLVSGASEAGTKMLSTFGVRYLILRPEADESLADALERQADLRFAQRFLGARVYRNEAALPHAASINASGWAAAAARRLGNVAAAEPDPQAGPGFRRRSPTSFDGTVPSRAKQLVLAEEYNPNWRAVIGRRGLPAGRSFGWGTRFSAEDEGRSQIHWQGQLPHQLALLAQAAIALMLAGAWSRRAAAERGER